MVTESEFQAARKTKSPKTRQKFLDSAYNENLCGIADYCRGIFYVGPHSKGFHLSGKTPFFARLGIKGFKMRLLVHENGFNFISNLAEFKSVLRHERLHGKDMCERPDLYATGFSYGKRVRKVLPLFMSKKAAERIIAKNDVILAKSELRACKINLNDIQKNPRMYSVKFKRYLHRKINDNKLKLKEAQKILKK